MSSMADSGEMAAPKRSIETREGTAGLRAGSVDDNADYQGFLEYLGRLVDLDLGLRPWDARGRVVVTVTGSNSLPVVGQEVGFSIADEDVATLMTTADGTVRFLPGAYGAPVDGTFGVRVDGTESTVGAGESVNIEINRPGGVEGAVSLDVLFLLDATGSMGDEIDRLKESIDSVALRVAELEGDPDVRFAMTLYRDRGDAFVTSTFDFTADVDAFRDALANVRADGGGDYPEALEEGLAEALASPSWRPPGEAVKLVFLVADAPPHTKRDVPVPYPAAIRDAVSRGVKIFPIASSESDDRAEAVFRVLAQATGAPFVFLSYGADGAATGRHTDIDRIDYEELALDDLVVRLTAEEIAAVTGGIDVVPTLTPEPTDEPTPPGQ